jgi:peptidoglycan/xylan/chitin deacetylase (PgdA/CDA1 family)
MEEKRWVLCRLFVIVLMLTLGLINAFSQSSSQNAVATKQIAITIDDLPLNGSNVGMQRLQAMTGKLIAAIQKYKIPAVGFVNESLLYVPGETDARISILRTWQDGGIELGNHTFSHPGFTNTPISQYEDDFIRGETVTKMMIKEKGQKIRYFRHPFLQMGPTLDLEKSFERFIAERGYKIAPVTIDTMDWMFLAGYENARSRRDSEGLKKVSNEYLKFAEAKFDFCERASNELFGRQIKHILLLHANELNADNLDRLFAAAKKRGYTFVTLEEGLKDPLYRFPDRYKGTSDWLDLWAFSEGKKFESPMPPDFIQRAYSDAQKASALSKSN